MNIATIIGARPQFIKAAVISDKINDENLLSEIIIHTGQHFEKNMSNIFFDEMNIKKPSYNLNINQIEYAQMVDKMVHSIYPILLQENIKGVMVYGDTNSTLAGSLAAKLLDIPIFHVESGLRSYNRSMYEENNRILVDHLSSLLFCPNDNAINNLTKENLSDGVLLSGDVMYDAYLRFSNKAKAYINDFQSSKYILATIHRRENITSKEKLSAIFGNLDKINHEKNIVMPLHPHTKKMIENFKIQTNISFIQPVGYIPMLSLLNNCEIVITDSGGLQKESFFAKKKCITIRKETEWTELIDQGANLLCDPKDLFNSFKRYINKECDFLNNIYGDGNASNFIVKSIISYFSERK